MKITEKIVRDIISSYNHLYDDIPPIDYIIIGRTKDVTTSPATVVNIDDEYALFINTDDYIFSEDILVPIILHEMVHYYLLLNGKQAKGDEQHNEIFQEKAREIEKETGIDGINSGCNHVQANLRYKNKRFAVIILKKYDTNTLNITLIPDKRFNYWAKYLKLHYKELGFDTYDVFRTNKQVFGQINSFSDGYDLLCESFALDEHENVFCK